VTRQPEFSEIGTRINGDIGLSFDSAELMRSVRSTVNIGTPTLAAIASADYLTAGNRRVGGGVRIGPSDYSALGARLALAGQPSDVWRWAVDLQYAEQPETPRVDELVPGFGQTEPASSEFRFEPDRRTFLHGRLERDAGWLDLDWRADAAWQRIDDDRATRDFGSPLRRRERNASDLFGLTLSAGRDTERGSWLVGAEHYDDRVDSSRFETDISDGTAQGLAPRFPDGARVRQSSLYTHVAHDLTDRQTLNAGLRLSRASITLPEAQATAAASLSVTDIGADIGWIFAITDAWQFVANAGRGFRAPNIFDLGTLGERPGNRFNVPNTALDSERVQHADAGFRYRRARDQFELIAYRLRYDDRITSVLTGDVTPAGRDVVRSENGERADIYGIEAGGRWALTGTVTGHAVLNYTRGEQREFDNPAEPGDRIPPLSGRLGIDYAGNAFTAEGWVNFSREQNRLSARDVRDPRIDPAGTAGWVSVDARVTWQDVAGWQITAGVRALPRARLGHRRHRPKSLPDPALRLLILPTTGAWHRRAGYTRRTLFWGILMRYWLAAVLGLFLSVSVSAQDDDSGPGFNEATFKGLEWRSIGPSLKSGRIADIAIHPENASTWYVAVGSGGVWKTENRGTTWTPIFDNEDSYSVGAVAIDPNNPDVIWVGTGENVSGRHVGYGSGVYVSRDGGKNWENTGLEDSERIGMIRIDPRDSNTVFVAAQGPLWSGGGDRGLYKTTDAGENWTKVLGDGLGNDDTDDDYTGVSEVHLDPRDPDVMYAVSWQRLRSVAALLDGGPGTGIHKSFDGGETWRELTQGLPKETMGKTGVAVSPVDPDIVYATIELANRTGGFWRSLDGGETWEKRNDYLSSGTGPHYYQEIFASPFDKDRVYQMDVRMHITEDGGNTFAQVPGRTRHSDHHALAFDLDDPLYLLAGTDGGIYESYDGGEKWRYVSNLPITQYYKVAVDYDTPFYNVYGGTQDNNSMGGPSRTVNAHGITNGDWFVTLFGDGHQSAVDPNNPDIIYAEWQQGNLVR
ncbi:MAG: TonB-dependent receptor, partial [Pseudomonadota bacterium]